MDIAGICSICGRTGHMTTCPLCGRLVCTTCLNTRTGACVQCSRGRFSATDS